MSRSLRQQGTLVLPPDQVNYPRPLLNTMVSDGDSFDSRNRFTQPVVKVSGTAGTFTITVNGQTTSALPYNETLANVQTAVNALSTVNGNATVTGTAGATYSINMTSTAAQLGPTVQAVGTGGCTARVDKSTMNSAQGIVSWVNVLTRQRLKYFGPMGVFGSTSDTFVSRFDTNIAPLRPGWIILTSPASNDVASSTSVATIQSRLSAYMDKCASIGARLIICTIPARNALTTAQRNTAVAVNRWLRETIAQGRPGVFLVDAWALTVDPATGFLKSGIASDGIHMNGTGAQIVGSAIANIINTYAPAVDVLGWGEDTDLQAVMTNPNLTGTTGTLNNGVTGSAATGWTVGSITGAAVTATASKVARTDNLPGEWQQVQITSGEGAVLSQNLIFSGLTAGTSYLDAMCEFQTDADWANITQFYMTVSFLDNSFSGVGGSTDLQWISGDTYTPSTTRPASGVFRIPKVLVPAAATKATVSVLLKGQGTFRVGRIGVYRS